MARARCLTKVTYPWTNGQVARMNRTIEEATVKRDHYDSHAQLEVHLKDFVAAYNYARRLKTLKGLTPFEYIHTIRKKDPGRFTINPNQLMPGPYKRPGKVTALKKDPVNHRRAIRYEYLKARIRAKMEHPFRIIKCQFDFVKARYKGLAKSDNQLAMLFNLANLVRVDQPTRARESCA